MRKFIVFLAAAALLMATAGVASATPDKAKGADKKCGDCHSRISHKPFGND